MACERIVHSMCARPMLEQLMLHRGDLEGVIVESTYNWDWLVDGLMEAGYRVHFQPVSDSTV